MDAQDIGASEGWASSASLDALLAGLEPAERLIAFSEAHLGTLREYDRRHHADLVRTLDAYFSCGASLAATAAVLQTHRNTVLYRLRRIESLAQARLRDPQTALDLQVALRIGATLDR
jgi:DNA-binding PucR family transcriptional regulator